MIGTGGRWRTSPGATDVVGWTDTGTSTNVIRDGLALVAGQNYYFSVRATNGLGMTSIGVSSTILAVQSLPTVAAAKALPDGTAVMLTLKPITAVFLGKFYIVESDRSSGIGVIWTEPMTIGANVTIIGTLTTTAGERFIQAIDVF